MLEHKFCQPDTALSVTDGAEISGYASIFGLRDQGGDTVAPGAYADSLKALKDRAGCIKMLWQHDPAQPVGVWTEVREDARGLFVKGRILTDVRQGAEAVALIQAGAIDGLSIGYRTRKASKAEDGGRVLNQLDLWEVSLVTFPMLPDARVAAKTDHPDDGGLSELTSLFRAARAAIQGP